MRTLIQDLRYAVRMLRQSPGFTAVAVISLAIGIGANTTIFSLVNAALLRPLPRVRDEARLVDVNRTRPNGDTFAQTSYPNYEYLRDHNDVFDGLAAYTFTPLSVSAGGEAERARGMLVTGNYFDVLGVRPARGRFFLPEEDRASGTGASSSAPVAVVAHEFWQRRFGGASDVVGKSVTVNGHPFTIVGVLPEGFKSPFIYLAPDVYVPMSVQAQAMPGRELLGDRGYGWLGVRGRLKDEVSIEQARAAMSVLAEQLAAGYPAENGGQGVSVRSIGHVPGEVRSAVVGFMATLTVIVALVLLVACANFAGMFLARASARRKELAIRTALGATRGRIIRQLLTESVLLFLCGGVLGTVLAVWMNALLQAFRPAGVLTISFDIEMDWRVLCYTLGVSLLTGVVFGLAPALATSKPDVIPALKDAAPGGSRRTSRTRGAFVVAQIAISLVLLVAAGLCVQSLRHASRIDPGFEADGVQLASIDLSLQGYDEARGREFYRRLKERVATLPGVESATLARSVPLSGLMFGNSVRIEGHEPPAGQPPLYVLSNTVDEDYLRALHVPLVAGRDFRAGEGETGTPRVAVINETMATRYFGGASEAVGQRFTLVTIPNRSDSARRADASIEIVGVTRDGRYYTLGEEAQPFMYLPFAQDYRGAMTLHVRATGGGDTSSSSILAAVRREARSLDPNLPLVNVMPMTEAVGFSLIPLRLAATVVGALGLTGLLLAALGVYGVIAYSVAGRTKEIGIRIALGARGRDVLGLVVRQGLLLAVVGVCLGLVGALALTRYLSSLLYGVSARDPFVFAVVALLLGGVALLASYVPARRATKIDPMTALRYE